MISRLLFVLLLAANIGLGAWLYVTPREQAPSLPATDPGVAALVLLSERDGSLGSAAELASAPVDAAIAARDRCLRIGPFPSQADLRRAMTALTPQVERLQFRETRTRQSRGFLVFLAAPATRGEALSVARDLSAGGVRDYYVVTAGNQQNSISLGLFRERANADRRRAEIAALGFAPEVTERVEDLPMYWLDVAVRPDAPFDWRDHLPDFLGIRDESISCF
ncbi:MAG TPA: SPOR domain-containing protein [Candidatus Saccharimonadia bacterium]|nr:SPOR domain-containing protein [Candidatus Saccharimonadia bacterium]